MSMADGKATQLSDKISGYFLLPQLATATIELIINKALRLNNKPISFATLSQKTLILTLTELPFSLCFTVQNSTKKTEVIVRAQADDSDCVIQTSLQTLTKIKAEQSLTDLIKRGELDVIGDIKVAQQFAAIAQSLEIDWQSELAKHLGDVPTHKLLQLGNKVSKNIAAKTKQLEADISEYIVHEKRLIVTNSQISAFNQQSQDIAEQVDNLSSRVDKLIALHNAISPTHSTN
ncbi:SCP2 sterol-binding domain-containing protein [Colwellia sp. E2M01]|uniref:ubiquinone biosynthesis accessory factor UbiJ n=1 Tax=Colwellia sp. E2M01 TaxID=2841561 RepID=UPI001C08E86E|nr:SCP2 sterol-binding domain-containing protein [Colwellia sp. E2M01]MBU2871219.1 SCP2 sterol-binding domain-containing protein [Colwellia sp. E2M01]